MYVCANTHTYTCVRSDTSVCTWRSEVFIGMPIFFWSEWSWNVHSFIWQNVLYNSWAKLFSCVLCHVTRQSMLLSIIYQSPILIKDIFFIEAECLFPSQYTCENWQWVRLPIVLDIIAVHIYLVSLYFFVFSLSHSPSRELKLTLNAWSVSLLLGLEGLDTRSSSFMLTREACQYFQGTSSRNSSKSWCLAMQTFSFSGSLF